MKTYRPYTKGANAKKSLAKQILTPYARVDYSKVNIDEIISDKRTSEETKRQALEKVFKGSVRQTNKRIAEDRNVEEDYGELRGTLIKHRQRTPNIFNNLGNLKQQSTKGKSVEELKGAINKIQDILYTPTFEEQKKQAQETLTKNGVDENLMNMIFNGGVSPDLLKDLLSGSESDMTVYEYDSETLGRAYRQIGNKKGLTIQDLLNEALKEQIQKEMEIKQSIETSREMEIVNIESMLDYNLKEVDKDTYYTEEEREQAKAYHQMEANKRIKEIKQRYELAEIEMLPQKRQKNEYKTK